VRRAAALFKKNSYHAVGIRDILKTCGISKGTFYFYFLSKLELGEAVIDEYTETIPSELRRCFDDCGWRDGVAEFLKADPRPKRTMSPFGLCMTRLGLEFAHDGGPLALKASHIYQLQENALVGALEQQGLAPDAAARRACTALAVIVGHLQRHALTGDMRHVEQAKRHIAPLGDSAPAPRKAAAAGRRGRAREGAAEYIARDGRIDLDSIDDRSIIRWLRASGQPQTPVGRKRMDIVRRAAICFWDRGYAATALDNILDECLVPKGSFHYYFPSKRALASAVLACYGYRAEEILDKALASGRWKEAADVMCYAASRIASGTPGLGCPLGNMGLEFANSDRGLGLQVAGILQSMEDRLRDGLMREGLGSATAAEKASYAVALLQGHSVRLMIRGDVGMVAQLREDLLQLVGKP
jgi:AcrR family transcriptional regulator